MLKIGQSQLRFEDDALITGRGRYTADLPVKGEVTMVIVRSQVASGKLVSVDTEAAAAMPSVIAVFTGADMMADGISPILPRLRHPGPDGGDMPVPLFYPLAVGAVRYVGDPIALVIAETKAAAIDAAEAVVPEIEERPVVVDALEAVSPDAPLVWDEFPDNRCFSVSRGDRKGAAAAIDGAAHVIRQRLRISRVTAASIEMRGALAMFDPATDGYRLEIGTQAPHRIAMDLAPILGVPAAAIHVVANDCGGSFGMKNAGYPEYAAALWAAKKVGRPVRWSADRLESFQSDAHARDQWVDVALALDADARFLALDVHVTANLGAYLGPATPHSPVGNIGGMAGVYRIPQIHVLIDGVFTNTQNTAPYRGAGRPEATYVIERIIDIAAHDLGMDRAELRRRNLVGPQEMPFSTGFVFTYDSGDFPAVLERALQISDWAGFEARRAASRQKGLMRGIGIANPIEIAGGPAGKPNPEFARLELSPEGKVRLFSGSRDTGQGHGTAFRQILADRLGLDTSQMEFITGDTEQVAHGIGTFGSRTLGAAGTAIWRAADAIIEQLKGKAADRLEAATTDIVFEAGRYQIAGTDQSVAFSELLAAEPGMVSAEDFSAADGATFPNGCHICEVEVDPDTGHVDLLAYSVVDDVGTVINPLLMKGQIIGGVAQGLGQALMENAIYDPQSGQLLSATFMDYAMPRAFDLPAPVIESFPVPTSQNPLGVKGAGEAGTVGSLAAIISAVCDALGPEGVRHFDMPATPERVWRCLRTKAVESDGADR